jgi:poly(A) polymerase Pap1
MVVYLQSLLAEYDKVVIRSAQQIRTYVTNKLIAESASADARIRLKSLEMLGKISDVGLFTDKTEITMRHRPTEELEQLLRERLTKVLEAEVMDNTKKPAIGQVKIDVSDVDAI